MSDEQAVQSLAGLKYFVDQAGPSLGPIRLVSRSASGFTPVSQALIEERLAEAFGTRFDCTILGHLLGSVCQLLNEGMLGKVAALFRFLKLPPVVERANEDISTVASDGKFIHQEHECFKVISYDESFLTKESVEVVRAIWQFVEAAKSEAAAELDEDETAWKQASGFLRQAIEVIERETGSFDPLLPLLDHPEPDVRVKACLILVDDHYEMVIPVLQLLDVAFELDASRSAAITLQMYGEPNLANRFKSAEPLRRPKPRRRP